MPAPSILTREQLDEFERRGVLPLRGLLAADRVRRAREYVQHRLARFGLWKDGRWCLGAVPRPEWPATGLGPSQAIGNEHPDVEGLLEEPALLCAVAALLGGCALDRTRSGPPQILFTLPNSDTWMVPATNWHVDFPRLATGRRPGVQLFAFLDTVEPRGGGTLVVAGSHRLLNDKRFVRSKALRRLLGRETFFRELYSPERAGGEDRARLLGEAGAVGDVPLEVIELTGAPGDAYFTDPRVLHTAAPNATDRPRIMATHRFVPVDVLPELARAFTSP